MEFKKRCKEGFEKWFNENHEMDLYQFNFLPLSMQFGVVVDYADSIGYSLEIRQGQKDYTVVIYQNSTDEEDCVYYIETRDEARKAAIKAFDEIVNG